MNRGRVEQFDVLADVRGRQSYLAAVFQMTDLKRTILVALQDVPGISVADEVLAPMGGQAALVLARDDPVPSSGQVPVVQLDAVSRP